MAGVNLYTSRDQRRRTWAWLTPVLVWLFIQFGGRISEFAAGLVGLHSSAASGRWQDNIVAFFSWGTVLLALGLWLRFWEGRQLSDIGFAGRPGPRFIAGLIGGLGMVMVVVAAGVLLGGYTITGPGAWFGHLTPTWLFAAVLTLAGGTLQAAAKEALFRGWLMQAFARSWGAGLAVAANVAAFAVIHGLHYAPSPQAMTGIVNLGLMSWLLGRVAVRDNSLWGVCGLHTAWNLTCNLGLGLNVNGEHLNVTPLLLAVSPQPDAPWWLTGADFGPNGSVLMTAVIAVVLLAGRRRTRARRRYDDDDDILE